MQAEQTVDITPGPCRQSKQSHLPHTLGKVTPRTGNHTPYNISLTFCAFARLIFSARRARHLFLRGMTKTPDSRAREGKRTPLQLRTAEPEDALIACACAFPAARAFGLNTRSHAQDNGSPPNLCAVFFLRESKICLGQNFNFLLDLL